MKEIKFLKVLIVDDSLHIRKIIKAVCESIGIKEIVEATDGRMAFDYLKTKKTTGEKGSHRAFDLVICDWMMPEMTGMELLMVMRRHPNLKRMPFLMVTAEGESENVMQALELGVSDYVVKPFTADILEQKLRGIIAKM